MVKRRTAFTLRYGESQRNDMLVYFDDDETVLENLSRIIPSAIQRGFLPPECSADSVKLIHQDRALNLNVGMKEQDFTVAERALLIIHDLSSTVRIKINYQPDNHAERSETVYVNPNKILKDELAKFFDGVAKDYTFYRRTPKKFNLVGSEGRKVNLNKSLLVQGVETGFDAALEPRLIFRWPPGKLTIGAAAAVVVVVLGFVLWSVYMNYLRRPPVIDTFYVTFVADVDVALITPDTTVALSPLAGGQTLTLPPGLHEFEVMPKDYPIVPQHFTLISEGATSDSLTMNINILDRFTEPPGLSLVINGYQGEETPDHKLKSGLFINGHVRELDAFGVLRIDLYRGDYEITYELPITLLDVKNMEFDPKVLRKSPIRFDFSEIAGDNTYLTFRYFPSQ
jgi:hypothetical protein